jgi:hypothetical protein
MTEMGRRQFSIGVENELRKDQLFRDAIEGLKEDKIKKGENKYFVRLSDPHAPLGATTLSCILRTVKQKMLHPKRDGKTSKA